MAYLTYNDLLNYIDAQNLAMMTQDYGVPLDGAVPNNNIIGSICQQASDLADSLISSIYKVPFATPPAKIKQAAIIFALEILWARRKTPTENNPWTDQAKYWRETLIQINLGMLSLDEQYTRGFTPVVASKTCGKVNTNFF